jgi:hypothetical protein
VKELLCLAWYVPITAIKKSGIPTLLADIEKFPDF